MYPYQLPGFDNGITVMSDALIGGSWMKVHGYQGTLWTIFVTSKHKSEVISK